MTDVIGDHVEVVEGAGGPRPRIKGSRIRVVDVAIWYEKLGLSADEIVREYPQLTLADVHAALAYYFDNREEIEEEFRKEDEVAERLRARYPSKVQEKLRG